MSLREICLGLFFIAVLLINGHLGLSLKLSFGATDCKVYDLEITDCGLNVSRIGNQKFGLIYKKTCNLKKESFAFYFGLGDKYAASINTTKTEIKLNEMKKQLDMRKVKFQTGTHYIYAEMSATTLKDADVSLTSEKCTFYIRPENPTAYLGRLNRNVRDQKTFVVDASHSKNYDQGETNVGLIYKWTCEDSVGFCAKRNLGTASKVTVDESFAKLGATFKFRVQVKAVNSPWMQAIQLITVNSMFPFAINCISYCWDAPNKLNPLLGAALFAECQFSCERFDKSKIQGVLKYVDERGSDVALHRFALGPKIIKSIVANSRIKVIAYYEDEEDIVGEQEFESFPIPKLENCKAIPPEGNPLTKFRIECSYYKEFVKNFEIQVKAENTVVFSSTSRYLEDIEFVIPRGSTVMVKLQDINHMVISQKVQVEIQPLVEENKNVSEVQEHLNDILDGKVKGASNVEKLIVEGNHGNAVQIIDVVARELSKIKAESKADQQFIADLKERLLNTLSKVPIIDVDMSKSVSGIASLLASQNADNLSSSEISSLQTKLCSAVAQQHLYLTENDVKGEIQEQDVIDITNNLLKCGEREIDPKYEIFNETAVEIEITTQYPIRDDLSENDVEDYPEYVVDDLLENEMNNFIDSAQNVMNICRDMGKSLVIATTSYDELPTYIEREGVTIGIFKSTGVKIADTIFRQHNVTVTVPQLRKDTDALFSVQLCTFKEDPFWSASETFKIDTNVLQISVANLATQTEITQFGAYPVNISLRVLKDTVKKITEYVNFLNESISEYPEDNFTIFTIKVKAMESFFMESYNLGEFDNISAVLTDMERPLLHDFRSAHFINKADNKILINNEFEHDRWLLLALIPKPNAEMANTSSGLEFSSYTLRCVTWNSRTKSWDNSCPVTMTTTTKIIHCRCSHLSILAGSFRYNDIKKLPKFIEINFTLKKRGSLHICVTVCITVFIYFFLLVYSIQKRETKEDAVYFLSDIPSQNRYSYLVLIRTGRKLDAGTTSDIVIQIFGTQGKSQEHVINFPDPFLELLQTDQTDMFVLATSKYLGNLQRIHLWFDCAGSSPNWYCSEVRIYDLQRGEWFLFKVKKWLRVDGKSRLFLDVPVARRQSISKERGRFKNMVLKIWLNFGNFKNTIWNPTTHIDNPNFGLPKRTTLVLSILLTMMAVLILFHGKPEMMPRDTITSKCYYEFDWKTIYVGVYSAMITFFPHIILLEGFKNSRLQYQDESSEDIKMLPFTLTVIIWVILIVNIFVQIHFLVIFGYWVIEPTVWEWTTSLLVALVFYIFVLDYIYHIFLATGRSALEHGLLNYEKILKNVETQRKFLYSLFGRYICRPILTPLYEIMGEADFMRKNFYFKQKREVFWQIQDFLMIIAFLLFLYMIIMDEKNTTYDVLGHDQALALLRGHSSRKLKLSRVNEIDEFEEFMANTFIPTIQSHQWYGRYMTKSPGLTTDVCNRYLGIIRIRQHRVEDSSCNVTTLMQFVNKTCRPVVSSNFDYLNYTPAWTNTIPEFYSSRLGYVWGYHNAEGESDTGVAGYYRKGGYIAFLGRTEKNSIVNFEYLRRYDWIDPLTRVIFIEFPLYNVNTNLFNFAKVVLERTLSGYIRKEVSVKSVRVVTGSPQATTASIISSLIFMALIFLIASRTTIRVIRTKIKHRRDIWHLVDIGIVFLGITWIVMYFRRMTLLKHFSRELEEKQSNIFVEYFDMMRIESLLKILASLLICTITIRIWRLLRFANVFRTVERTLLYSFESLIYCLVYFFIYCILFVVTGFIVFGTTSSHFKDSTSTMKTLMLMTIGLRGPSTLHLDDSDIILGYAYIVIFFLFTYLFTAIFIAIIIVHFLKAQQFAFEEVLEYNMKDYTNEKFETLKRMAVMWTRKFRLKAGGKKREDEEMVTPKGNDVRYLNCVSVDSNRMIAMASVAKCVILKRKKGLMLAKSDHLLMMGTVRNLCNKKKGEYEFFFKQDTKAEGCKFVDNRRILMMEEIVKQMLETPEIKATRMKKLQVLREQNLAKIEMLNKRLKSMLRAIEDIEVKFGTILK